MYFITIFLVFYLSLAGFLNKAGYKFWYGFIPIYNIYLFFKVLKINPALLLILGLGLIFLKDRMFIATLIYIFLPFIISYTYNKNILVGFLTLIFPQVMLPFIAYFFGFYIYEEGGSN